MEIWQSFLVNRICQSTAQEIYRRRREEEDDEDRRRREEEEEEDKRRRESEDENRELDSLDRLIEKKRLQYLDEPTETELDSLERAQREKTDAEYERMCKVREETDELLVFLLSMSPIVAIASFVILVICSTFGI